MILYLQDYVEPGDPDHHLALERCLALVPDSLSPHNDTSRRCLGATIYLEAGTYTFNEFALPANKRIELRGSSQSGTRIVSSEGAYAFLIDSEWTSKLFYGLYFDECGVRLLYNARGAIKFEACHFDSTPDWAICTEDEGVVRPWVDACVFNRCDGAIGILYPKSDNWRITNCTFLHSAGTRPAILSRSSGIRIYTCDFENRSSVAVPAYIQVAPALDGSIAGGMTFIETCRFGGEQGTGFGPPPAMVLLGGTAETSGTMSFVRIDRCDFRTPQSTFNTTHAIALNKAVNMSVVMGNMFARGYASLLKYNNLLGYLATNNIRDNVWEHNTLDSNAIPAQVVVAADRTDDPPGAANYTTLLNKPLSV